MGASGFAPDAAREDAASMPQGHGRRWMSEAARGGVEDDCDDTQPSLVVQTLSERPSTMGSLPNHFLPTPGVWTVSFTSGHNTDNKAPRYTRLHSSRMSMGITEPYRGSPVQLG